MNIFISLTYEDLKEERKEALSYIDRIGHSVAMEKFFASDFANYEKFFRPFTDRTRLFNHLHSLVGREDILKALDMFVESDKRVGILNGRVGGNTKPHPL